MRGGKARFGTEFCIGPFRVQPKIAGIGPDIARDEPLAFESRDITVLDGCNIGGLDLQLALNIQQRPAKSRAFTAHDIPKTHLEIVKAFRLVDHWRRRLRPPPDHSYLPYCPIPHESLCPTRIIAIS